MKYFDDDLRILVFAIVALVFVFGCSETPRPSPATPVPEVTNDWRAPARTNKPASWSELSEVTPTNSPVCADGPPK